jgi:hypothetical protein
MLLRNWFGHFAYVALKVWVFHDIPIIFICFVFVFLQAGKRRNEKRLPSGASLKELIFIETLFN